jgi:hypothetical protein
MRRNFAKTGVHHSWREFMAKYKVMKVSTSLVNNGNGYQNIVVDCELVNSSNNPARRKYRIATDDRHPDLNNLHSIIDNGLKYSVDMGIGIDISEYKERMYLFFTLPSASGKTMIQVTGERM